MYLANSRRMHPAGITDAAASTDLDPQPRAALAKDPWAGKGSRSRLVATYVRVYLETIKSAGSSDPSSKHLRRAWITPLAGTMFSLAII
jgi:hypothetical protein